MLTEEARERLSSPGKGLGLFATREPQRRRFDLPPGTLVVSADSHYPLTQDIFYENFPKHLRDRATRVLWDDRAEFYPMYVDGKPIFEGDAIDVLKSMEDRPGSQNLTDRMKDLDAEGVDMEIVYPQVLSLFFKKPDYEAREWTFRVYNRHLAEMQALQPDRFFPVPIGNYWDPQQCGAWVDELAKLGLKCVMLPLDPGARADGSPIFYSAAEYDPMWRAMEETGLPLSFHVGEQLDFSGGPASSAPTFMSNLGSSAFRRVFGELVFGHVFDRFPKLQVVFAEANINWVPGAIQDAEMMFNSHALMYEKRPKHRPTHYWFNNCYATFIADIVGLKMIDMIGRDRVMFSMDYPHNEGTFGYTQDALEAVVETARDEDEIRAIVGGTAVKVYNL
ncbi:MAG: amidohydrolase family protein [Sphingomonadaceae bacterium]